MSSESTIIIDDVGAYVDAIVKYEYMTASGLPDRRAVFTKGTDGNYRVSRWEENPPTYLGDTFTVPVYSLHRAETSMPGHARVRELAAEGLGKDVEEVTEEEFTEAKEIHMDVFREEVRRALVDEVEVGGTVTVPVEYRDDDASNSVEDMAKSSR